MKNKQLILILILILIVLFAGIFVYKNQETFNSLRFSKNFPFFEQIEKQYNFSGQQVFLIDNSDLIDVSIKDKRKLEQIIRRYPTIFEPPYQNIKIIFSDEMQDYTFTWSSGTPFSHSVDLFTFPSLNITINVNPAVLKAEGWSREQVEMETEGILIYALERAKMNVVPETATTTTEQEEQIKSDLIESNAQEAIMQTNTDNQNSVFNLKYD